MKQEILFTKYRSALKHRNLMLAYFKTLKGVIDIGNSITGSFYIEYGDDNYSIYCRFSNHLKPGITENECIKHSINNNHNYIEISVASMKEFKEAFKYITENVK